ncbi:MAG: tRNA uridine-5-carboxymethylaminomethyl(34) synthesis GTPase MnmE, partial [Candidatus Electryoneaceae bacterium]|nr:tRNA uridine-5-carboxymethylaminomethyl(34) synthesis GTPase MnmE [Candidatus Electryoneaceae bacterium]
EGDTIAAEATPPGRGGISVIRVSGPLTMVTCGRFFNRPLPSPGCHRFGEWLRVPSGEAIIDEVVIACFSAPNSYTGEDVVEISTHGTPVIVADVLNCLYSDGVRPAQPGEFTYRAFLNGRIDLTQAEAVADLINSSSQEAADQAIRQLRGGIGLVVERIAEGILSVLTQCELELDFVDEDVELTSSKEKLSSIRSASALLEGLLSGYQRSRRLREGVSVAIVGSPNVGKSSLFNRLLEDDRAIVHSQPGTTRDIVTGHFFINGIRFNLFDTAGMRVSEDEIEEEGIRRDIEAADSSDVIISVISVDIMEDVNLGNLSRAKVINVLNKIDLVNAPPSDILHGINMIKVSSHTGVGINQLRESIYNIVVSDSSSESVSISRERHYRAVMESQAGLGRAESLLLDGAPVEIIAEELRDSLSAIDSITGKHRLEGLLDRIFSEFCVGK